MRSLGVLALICVLAGYPGLSSWAQYVAPPKAAAKPVITLRIVGSTVKNHKGEYYGRIEDIIVNTQGKTEFAMLLLNYPKNTTRVTPVPWPLLTHLGDQGQAGGTPGAEQTFQLNIERTNLVKAPMLDKSQWSLLQQQGWRQYVYSLYGLSLEAPASTPAVSSSTPSGTGAVVPVPVYPNGGGQAVAAAAASANASLFVDDHFFDDNNNDNNNDFLVPSPSIGVPTQLAENPLLDEFGPLFPGGQPIIPNGGANIFAAGTNFFPGAPARLPTTGNNITIPPGTRLVPSQPGAPFSTLVPPNSVRATPANPGQPWSVLIPQGSTPAVPQVPGAPFSPLIPSSSTPAVAQVPGAPFSPLVPSGSTPAAAANPGSAFSTLVPASGTPAVAATPGAAFSPLIPSVPQNVSAGGTGNGGNGFAAAAPAALNQGAGAGNGGSAFTPVIPTVPNNANTGAPGNPGSGIGPSGVVQGPQGPIGRFGPGPEAFGPRNFQGGPMPMRMPGIAPVMPLAPRAPLAPLAPPAGGRR